MEEIYSWVKNIVIFMLINTIIMNLLGNKSYKKYVSIVSGMILVLIVILPLVKLLKLQDVLDYYLEANDFKVESSDFKNELEHMEAKQSAVVFAEYKEGIRSQVKKILQEEGVYLESFQVKLDQNPESTAYGDIMEMKIKGSMENSAEEASGNRIRIEDIEMAQVILGKEAENKEKTVPSPAEITLKNRLSDFYNIEQGNININIQGG